MSTYSSSQPLHPAPPGVAVLVATHEPGRALLDLVEPLIGAGAAAILVVDDGSSSAREWLLRKLSLEPTVHLIRHSVPQGRGAALKTGIQYFLDHLRHYTGLVTVSAGGEYAAEDVLRVSRALSRSPKLAIVAAREFPLVKPDRAMRVAAPSVADRFFGLVFRMFTGIAISDVQTRLRALPTGLLPRLLRIPGSRFEYELATLFYIARSGYPLAEHVVPARLESANGDPEFRPLSDSVSMLRALLNCTPVDPFTPEHEQEHTFGRVDPGASGMKRSSAKQAR
jgi:glycosyltransferase involved in cell wall biosynthesis